MVCATDHTSWSSGSWVEHPWRSRCYPYRSPSTRVQWDGCRWSSYRMWRVYVSRVLGSVVPASYPSVCLRHLWLSTHTPNWVDELWFSYRSYGVPLWPHCMWEVGRGVCWCISVDSLGTYSGWVRCRRGTPYQRNHKQTRPYLALLSTWWIVRRGQSVTTTKINEISFVHLSWLSEVPSHFHPPTSLLKVP